MKIPMWSRLILCLLHQPKLLSLQFKSRRWNEFQVQHQKMPWGSNSLECTELHFACFEDFVGRIVSFENSYIKDGIIPSWAGNSLVSKLWTFPSPMEHMASFDVNSDTLQGSLQRISIHIRLATKNDDFSVIFHNRTAVAIVAEWPGNVAHNAYAAVSIAEAFESQIFSGLAPYIILHSANLFALEFFKSVPNYSVQKWNQVRNYFNTSCFRRIEVCRLNSDPPLNLAVSWRMGSQLVSKYKQIAKKSGILESSFPITWPNISDNIIEKDKIFRIVIIGGRKGARSILNIADILSYCSHGVKVGSILLVCREHIFGKDMMTDIRMMQSTDVLMGTHGAAFINLLFMKKGSHILEIFPHNYTNFCYERQLRGSDYMIRYWSIRFLNSCSLYPGIYEQKGMGRRDAWPRDWNIVLNIPWLHRVFLVLVNFKYQSYNNIYKYKSMQKQKQNIFFY